MIEFYVAVGLLLTTFALMAYCVLDSFRNAADVDDEYQWPRYE